MARPAHLILEYILTQFTDPTLFSQLGLSQPLLNALTAKGYTVPTPIQAKAIPTVLSGRDLLGIAQTGTGKTAAFVLPALDRLVAANKHPIARRARMLVLAPTRELASQIAESARTYAAGQSISVGVIFGGVPVPKSIREVARGLDVLVATPGRLLDLVDQRMLDLSAIEILVLDEADQMLDLGFIHALKRIVKIIPAQRQTLFFSATMPKAIRQLADAYLTNPAEVAVTPSATTVERIGQTVTFVNQAEKQALLTIFFQNTQIERALVFSRTKHGADKIVRFLEAAGIKSNAIHGNKSQVNRERALAAFRSGEVPILLATDIAARGIDIPGVSHVLNFDLPNVPEQYVHRIGRTARAGADGLAVAFCAEDERPYLKDIEKLTRQKIDVVPLPDGFMAAVAAIKRLKPAPKATDTRERQPHAGRRFTPSAELRGDRRSEGRRDGRNGQRPANPRPDARNDSRNDARNDQGPRPNPVRADHRGPDTRNANGTRSFDQFGRQDAARPHGERPHGDRPRGDRPAGDRPGHDRNGADRPRDGQPRHDGQPRRDGGPARPFGGGRGRGGYRGGGGGAGRTRASA